MNKSLGKPLFDCMNIGDFYDCGCGDDDEKDAKDAKSGKAAKAAKDTKGGKQSQKEIADTSDLKLEREELVYSCLVFMQ